MAKKKILIAEDESPIAKAMQAKLISEGYEVDIAVDGKETLEALKKVSYDLLMLDLVMPVLDGFGVLEALKTVAKKPKIVISTNLSQPEDEKRVRELGAIDFLVKSNTSLSDIVMRTKTYLE